MGYDTGTPGDPVTAYTAASGGFGQVVTFDCPHDLKTAYTRSGVSTPDTVSTPFDPSTATFYDMQDAGALLVSATASAGNATCEFVLVYKDGAGNILGLSQTLSLSTSNAYKIESSGLYPAIGPSVYANVDFARYVGFVVVFTGAATWNFVLKPV